MSAPPPEERLAEVEAALAARWPESRIDPSLARIADLLDLLGSPHRAAPAIAVAGTNGKTSTARMIESLLRAFGLRTGLTTSPHLTSTAERIVIDGEPITSERLVAVFDDIAAALAWADERSTSAGGPPLSYFETVTGLAFAAFADAPVDAAVLEVGMGGRWDATTVADATVAVLTPIDLDHAEYLGPDLASIAGEKAGVIKPGATAVIGPQAPQSLAPLLARCTEVGADAVRYGQEFDVTSRTVAVGGQAVSLRGLAGQYDDLFLPLHGSHQAVNAACAVVAVEAFLGGGRAPLDADVVAAGLAATSSPGRLEVVHREPTVLVDAAHNPAGAAALAAAVSEAFAFTSLTVVAGVLAEKDAAGILAALAPIADRLILTTAPSPRAIPAGDLASLAGSGGSIDVIPRLVEAVETAVADAAPGHGVLITGSVTVAGQARLLFGAESPAEAG